jgi:hypothetical protein
MDKDEFKFPDETEIETKGKPVDTNVDTENDIQVEVEDDTPPQDRGRTKSEPEYVEKLEKDELDEYSDAAKERIAGFRKIYHDERREKEKALREQQEAITLAQRLLEENRALKGKVTVSEQQALDSYMTSADRELAMAKKEYREAYDAGDSEKLVEAQEKMTSAKIKADRALSISEQRALQRAEPDVQIPQQRQQPVRDSKAESWRESNSWFGQDDEMTSLALGLHEKLVKENGMAYATTDEYYKRIDETMRKRFPENFESIEDERPVTRTKPSTVVAPASRSTSSKRIKLTTSQQAIAKKLGLTNEQYARELIKEM